ncbi:prepilin peptidase [Vibrio furnissii]|uniref:prepilin peptidase n=1 Tax=Vibrio furnissii TaxID=29494 RepID=UPI001E5AE6AC|nr:A24 family peptidase [Vibrio furnissii]MCG6267690.1 A24 family peptidase [Vibrio furnissii]UHJ60812.1 A24 family peptidase [Vibrio furnissii]
MNICIWGLLITVGVYDARQHRIPNVLLGLLMLAGVIQTLLLDQTFDLFVGQIGAMLMVFVLALMCHMAGWMAPGDVKLLAVIGFLTGFGHLADTFFYIGVSAIFIGVMYGMLNYLLLFKESVSVVGVRVYLMGPIHSRLRRESSRKPELVMPFAPVVVVGVALAQYAQAYF